MSQYFGSQPSSSTITPIIPSKILIAIPEYYFLKQQYGYVGQKVFVDLLFPWIILTFSEVSHHR
jgi:hypothetical protein